MGEFDRELRTRLEQLKHELMPRDPAESLALAEAFIQGDEVFFARADDPSGVVSDATAEAQVRVESGWVSGRVVVQAPGRPGP